MAKYEKALTENKKVLRFIDESAALCNPDRIVWIDGSKEQRDELRAEACATGELIKLNEDLLPECYLHRTAVNDVARVEDRTFICCKNKEDAGPINNWMDPKEAYAMASGIFKDSMKGRTMYVIPYSMGIVGSEFAKIGIELTDSIYVVLNMEIMTRVGTDVYDALGKNGDFVKGLHSKCALDESKRYILHFPEDDTIWSCNSGYGGNVLLGKKCFALRIASYLGKNEGWMAEHMLILGFEKPDGEVRYIAAAFPSACGKTNLAMLIPPEGYRKKGYKIWTVGDDIAWIRVGADGRLWAMNPENGFFGVAPGTNEKSNPNALHTTQKGTIFTNVAHNLDTNTVWWEGLDKNPPKNAVDWKGNPWGDAERAAGVKELTRTAASPPPQRTAPASARSSITRRACPCPPSCSAAEGQRPLLWSTRARAGTTACSSAPSWRAKRPPRRRAPSASSAAILWRCAPSAATTWAITSDTGSRWAPKFPIRPRSSTSTGSASTTRATSSGRASARTCACSSGS